MRVRAADRGALNEARRPARLPAGQRVAARRLERRRIEDVARREGVPGENGRLRPRVVVDLEVEVVAVELVRAGGEVIVGERRDVGRRDELDHLPSGRIDALGRNAVVREQLPPGSVRAARRGIVNQRARAGEVAVAERVARNGAERGGALPPRRALPVAEEEQLVLPDRAAKRPAELIQDVLRDLGADEEVVAGAQRAVGMEPLPAAVELVRPGLDRHAHRRSAGHALLGVEAVGDDVHRFDGVGGRHVGHDVRQPRVADRRAVEPRVVVGSRDAVEVGPQRPLRIARVGVELDRQAGAGDQLVELLEVAPAADRQVRHLRRVELRADIRAHRLQHRRRRHRHRLRRPSHFHAHVLACDVVERDGDAGLHVGLEPRHRDPQIVGAGLEIAKRVRPAAVGGGLALEASVPVGRRDGRSGEDGAGRVFHAAHQHTVEHLRVRRRGQKGEAQEQNRDESPDLALLHHVPPTGGGRGLVSSAKAPSG